MNGRAQTEEVEGVVESVNTTGLKIGGAWLNVSRFHPVELPEAGAHVRLKIDSKGYIVQLSSSAETPAVVSARDDRITRLAVLKAAAQFAADRADIRSADVLRIADLWLKWILE